MGIIKGVTLFVWFTKLCGLVSAWKLESITFDDFLDRLEKLQKLNPEAAATDQLETLKIELRFLKTLFKCMARNSNLKECSSPVISSIKRALWGLFSEYKIDTFDATVSNGLEAIEESRTDIRYFYELVPILSRSCVPMTSDILVGFMNDLVKNLEDLLSYKVNLVVPVKRQIEVLKEELVFLKIFLCFAANRCGDRGVIKRFSARLEGVAAEAACFSYSCLTDKETDEKFSNLLRKMRSVKQEIREIYIHVLETSSKSSGFIDEHVLDAIQMYIHYVDNMLEIMNFEPSLKLLKQDQVLKKFNDGLKFLKTLLMEPPRQYIEAENLNELLRSIGAVAMESGSLLFSLYADQMNEEIAKRVNLGVVDLLEKIEFVKREARDIYLKIPKSSQCKFPSSDGLAFITFFLEDLKDFLSSKHDSINFVQDHIETIQKDFELLTSLLRKMEERLHQQGDLKALWTRVLDVAYHAEYVIDSFVIRDFPIWYHLLWLDDIVEDIELIKADATRIHSKMSCGIGLSCISESSSGAASSRAHNLMIKNQIVGFEDEAEKVSELLLKGASSVLDVVSIVGMPGAGKTALVRKVYDSVPIEKHFHVRAWCTVSQVYQKKDLLLHILSCIGLKDEMCEMNVNDLAEVLYKRLRGRKYLLVLDDIWNVEVWQDLRMSFPDDGNGSRVLFTTRVLDVALQAKLHSNPHSLRPLNHRECWELLKQLVFGKGICPSELVVVGKQIAKNCGGLPLSVVLVSGLLAAEKTKNFWKEISQSLSSRIAVNDPENHCMDIIGLSYEHLPNHLKPCFLYFGAFLEDQDILSRKLKSLWNAEGFVRKVEGKRIEDTADDYLKDLHRRSLIKVTRRKADGGIKTCCLHNILSQFCKAKSLEEHFWQFHGCPNLSSCKQRRLCLNAEGLNRFTMAKPSGSHVRSLLLCDENGTCPSESGPFSVSFISKNFTLSFISKNFTLLRVLDLGCLEIGSFPDGLDLLVHLKYLALKASFADSLPLWIANLRNLEFFLVEVSCRFYSFQSIYGLRKLRHLHVQPLVLFNMDKRNLSSQDPDQLDSLETISRLQLSSEIEVEELAKKFPNIRRLSCNVDFESVKFDMFNKLESLTVWSESLTLLDIVEGSVKVRSCEFNYPSMLKKLTLAYLLLTQNSISVIGRLENLEVLKLGICKIENRKWSMVDGEFPNLRYLELYRLDLEDWNASDDHFPCLRILIVASCPKLKELPSCLGSLETLEMIRVRRCNRLDLELVQQIQQEQVDLGNDEFNLHIAN